MLDQTEIGILLSIDNLSSVEGDFDGRFLYCILSMINNRSTQLANMHSTFSLLSSQQQVRRQFANRPANAYALISGMK